MNYKNYRRAVTKGAPEVSKFIFRGNSSTGLSLSGFRPNLLVSSERDLVRTKKRRQLGFIFNVSVQYRGDDLVLFQLRHLCVNLRTLRLVREVDEEYRTRIEGPMADLLFLLRPGGAVLPQRHTPRMIRRDHNGGSIGFRTRRNLLHQFPQRVIGQRQIVQVIPPGSQPVTAPVVDPWWMRNRQMQKDKMDLLVLNQASRSFHYTSIFI